MSQVIEVRVMRNELTLIIQEETLTDNSIVHNVVLLAKNGNHVLKNSQSVTLEEAEAKLELMQKALEAVELL